MTRYHAHRIEPDTRLDPILSQVTGALVGRAVTALLVGYTLLVIVMVALGGQSA